MPRRPGARARIDSKFVVAAAQVWTKAWPAITLAAVRSVRSPRIGRVIYAVSVVVGCPVWIDVVMAGGIDRECLASPSRQTGHMHVHHAGNGRARTVPLGAG
jgi:hypothetical protein